MRKILYDSAYTYIQTRCGLPPRPRIPNRNSFFIILFIFASPTGVLGGKYPACWPKGIQYIYRLIHGDLRSSRDGKILRYKAQFSVLVRTYLPSYKSSILPNGSDPRWLNPGLRYPGTFAFNPLQSGHHGAYVTSAPDKSRVAKKGQLYAIAL